MGYLFTAILFFILGILSLFGYAHVILHPGDFTKMYYEDGSRPFWYLSEDEFSEVVKTRPNKCRKEM